MPTCVTASRKSSGMTASVRPVLPLHLCLLYRVSAAVQVYAVGGRGAAAAVSIAMACRAPEVLYKSAPEYGGVTGLWSLPARLGDAQHALAVLAFAATSRALAAGALLTHLSLRTWKATGRAFAMRVVPLPLHSLVVRLGDVQHALAVLAFADTSCALAAGALLTHPSHAS